GLRAGHRASAAAAAEHHRRADRDPRRRDQAADDQAIDWGGMTSNAAATPDKLRKDEGSQGRAQVRLAMPAAKLQGHYDVVVVGSGYGAGVAASRLARCGRKVAVVERGREFLPGDFPENVVQATRETQVSGVRGRIGSATALFDVRTGTDIHVMMACG